MAVADATAPVLDQVKRNLAAAISVANGAVRAANERRRRETDGAARLHEAQLEALQQILDRQFPREAPH